ncbi:MAG TPA: hypothetical protein VEA16_16945 [Vicinamibacterales bacterium]|nr:hypothetical protein [Vicinamibacterales bacterium]
MTANEIITGALFDLGVLAAGETPAAEDSEAARVCLNDLGDALGLERLTLYKTVRTTKTLASGTASYTIGSGADISVVKPAWIDRAMLVIDTSATYPTEKPISVLTPDEYAAWPQKTLPAPLSMAIFYDHGHNSSGYGTIYPLPIPNVGTTQLVLYTPGGEVATFADLVTDYALPRGYKRALRKNLALEIAPLFDAVPSPLLVRQADESKAALKRVNVPALILSCEPAIVGPGTGGHFNINIDGPNRGGL